MPQETAEVAYIEGKHAFLKSVNKSSCGECSSKASCGSVKLFKSTIDTEYTIKVENSLDLKAGDSVHIGLAPSKLIQGTLLVYISPIFSLFLFAALGKLWGGEGFSILAGLGGLFVALLLVKKYIAQKAITERFSPKILAKIDTIKD
ncbi:MAG: SoxR reducing system RseC family protein [Cocleimonas sp.]|nr:SoxR reducing system RseC family protein [Cocleimonas sp.]